MPTSRDHRYCCHGNKGVVVTVVVVVAAVIALVNLQLTDFSSR